MQHIIPYSRIESSAHVSYAFGMELNIHIRTIRKRRGHTIAELAEMVGVSTPHMSEVERGVKNLNNHLLLRIAAALNVDPDELISGDEANDLRLLMRVVRRLDQSDRQRVETFAQSLLTSRPNQAQKP